MSDWRELAYEAERDEPHNGEDFYTAIRRYFDLAALAQQLADRDAAWERAIQSLAEQGVITIDDPVAAVRKRMEAQGGGA